MPRLFSPYRGARPAHTFGHIAVAYVGAQKADTARGEPPLGARVRVRSADGDALRERARLCEVCREDAEDAVAVHDLPLFVGGDEAVGVAVVCEARVRARFAHDARQRRWMQGAAAAVDLSAVSAPADGDDLRAQTAEHARRKLPCRAVGAVHDEFFAGERHPAGDEVIGIRAAAGQPAAPAAGKGGGEGVLVEVTFGALFRPFPEFEAVRVEYFQTVVGGRIVRSADHDAEIRLAAADEKGDRRRRQDAAGEHAAAARRYPRGQGEGEHIRRGARILPHDDERALFQPAQRVAEGERRARRQLFSRDAADAVRTEIFTHLSPPRTAPRAFYRSSGGSCR